MEERSRTAGRLQRVEFVEKMGHRQGRFWSRGRGEGGLERLRSERKDLGD